MPLNAGLPAVPVPGWDVRVGRWITTTADKQTNRQSIPVGRVGSPILSTEVPHTSRPRRRNVSPIRLPKEGRRLQQNQSMDLMLRKVLFYFHPSAEDPNAEPFGLRHGHRMTDLLLSISFKTNSVFFFFCSFCFPFVTPRRSEWTGSISSALGDRWGGGNTGVSRTRVGCVVVFFHSSTFF